MIMARPESVADAIVTDDDGNVRSHYKEFVLRPAYQPIIGYDRFHRKWRVTSFEGLIRPTQFGRVVEVRDFFKHVDEDDRLFVECMCMALHVRAYKTVKPEGMTLFLNVDVSRFSSVEALETEIYYTFSQLYRHGLSRDRVVFEILETEVLETAVIIRICEIFRNNEFKFALDDFGTKHSNIERFLLVKPDIVKLDRSIFKDICSVYENEVLIRSLVAAFRANGARILMEGLETDEEVALAADMHVDMMQGFALAEPKLLPHVFDSEVEIPKLKRKTKLHLVADKGLKASR